MFNFGNAVFYRSIGSIRLNQPIVGIAPRQSGNGYWMVARDGGIFVFGDATFHGSTGSIHLNQPITSMASTLTGSGYWFVARDGRRLLVRGRNLPRQWRRTPDRRRWHRERR